MRRVVSIVCESMLWTDVESYEIPGYAKLPFDMRPSDLSASTLWLMQCDRPVPQDMWTGVHDRSSVFASGDFLSKRFKTRLFSSFWPKKFDPTALDPLASIKSYKEIWREPRALHYKELKAFVRDDFRNSDYRWLIYWSLAGHAVCTDCRLPHESKGIPESLRDTAREWLDLLRDEILGQFGYDDLIMIHPDHGSARRGRPREGMDRGFMFARPDVLQAPLGWASIRQAVVKWLS